MSLNRLAMNDRIVAIGLLTKRDLRLLGPAFDRAWPVEDASQFETLLQAIDEAERALKHVHAR
jgi:hypothetical protein